jgi:hypothetical protein
LAHILNIGPFRFKHQSLLANIYLVEPTKEAVRDATNKTIIGTKYLVESWSNFLDCNQDAAERENERSDQRLVV